MRSFRGEKKLPSDGSREQFELVRALLESARKKTATCKSGPVRSVLRGAVPAAHGRSAACAARRLFQMAQCVRTGPSGVSRAGGRPAGQALKSGWRGPRETGAQRLQRAYLIADAQRVKTTDMAALKGRRRQDGLGHQAPHCGGHPGLAAGGVRGHCRGHGSQRGTAGPFVLQAPPATSHTVGSSSGAEASRRIARRGIERNDRVGRHRWVVDRMYGWLCDVGHRHGGIRARLEERISFMLCREPAVPRLACSGLFLRCPSAAGFVRDSSVSRETGSADAGDRGRAFRFAEPPSSAPP